MATKEQYLANRLKYHAASRVGAKIEDPLANALNLDGHTVVANKVWSASLDQFPVNSGLNKNATDGIAASIDLVSVFKTEADGYILSGSDFNDGKIWTNTKYPAVKLYENVTMTPVNGSNGASSAPHYQSFEVLKDGIRVQDWVSPMAVFDSSNGKPVPGFTARIMATKKNTIWKPSDLDKTQDLENANANWALSKGTWEFIYGAGMVTFDPENCPGKLLGEDPKVRITAFAYNGEYLSDTIDAIQSTLGIGGGGGTRADEDENLTDQVARIDDGYLSGVASGLALSVTNKVIDLKTDNLTIGQDETNGLKSLIKIAKRDTAVSGYAATYDLVDLSGNAIVGSDPINIIKDQFLSDAQFIGEATEADQTASGSGVLIGEPCIKLTWQIATTEGDTDGKAATYVPVKKLVDTYTGTNGVKIEGYSVSGVVDSASESFLTVGADGFKVSGIQSAIDTATTNLENKLWDSTNLSGSIYDAVKANTDKLSGITSVKDAINEYDTALLSGITSGQVVIGDANGIKTTGYTIGGASLQTTDNAFTGSETVLVTESAIKNILDGTEMTDLDSKIASLISDI